MADFFTQLVGRTFDRAPTPRPIIAPLFAPGPMLASHFAAEIAQENAAMGERVEIPGRGVEVPGRLQGSPLQSKPVLLDNAETRHMHNTSHDTQKGKLAPETRLSPAEKQPDTAQQPERTVITPRSAVEPSYPLAVQPPLSEPPGPYSNQDKHLSLSRGRPPESAQLTSPVIKVSIGRIDVRAVMPSAPAQSRKTPPPAPQPSLNEYLEARNRGKP